MALLNGLVSYYKLDGNSNDSVGSNDGTDSNITYSTGKIGQMASFNGTTSSHIITSATNMPSIQGAKSVSLWLNSSSAAGNSIWSLLNSNSSPSSAIQITTDASGYLQIAEWGGSILLATNTLLSSTLSHFVYTYDGTTHKVYINNSLINSSTTVGQSGTSAAQSFGNYITGGSYNGNIDEVSVYNREITSTEVSELYNNGDGLQYPFNTSNFLQFF